jgi:hypothetical protein
MHFTNNELVALKKKKGRVISKKNMEKTFMAPSTGTAFVQCHAPAFLTAIIGKLMQYLPQ